MNAPIEMMLDGVTWVAIEGEPPADGVLHATHEGVLSLMGFDFKVYRLSDDQRVIDADSMYRFFGLVQDDAIADEAIEEGLV